MKFLLTSASFSSTYGGPAYSVGRLAYALTQAGATAAVWAPDGSASEAAAVQGEVERLGGTLEDALARFGIPDVVHDSGLWLPHNHAIAAWTSRRGVPRVVSTRGMLEPWARRHKAWKKALAWASYQRRDLRSAQLLHATSAPEAERLRALKLGPVEVVPNGVDAPSGAVGPKAGASRWRTALFLGRIYPVKGLPLLVDAWAQVRPEGWRLEIAGPDEAGHKAEVEALVRRARLEGVIAFRGALAGNEKSRALGRADLLILPSHSESFGLVVAEALVHGTPVLTTTAVPWDRLETSGVGWRVEPTASALAQGLRVATTQSRRRLREMGERGRAMVVAEYGWDSVARAFLGHYDRLVRGDHEALTRAA